MQGVLDVVGGQVQRERGSQLALEVGCSHGAGLDPPHQALLQGTTHPHD
jgi:hypothetical protein